MYKILYLTQFPEIGGGETMFLSLLEKLPRRLFEPIVIVPKKGQVSERLKQLRVRTYILNLPPYLLRTFFVPGISPLPMYKFIKLSKSLSPNLIHLNHLTLAIYAGVAAKILHIPTVATAHGPWDSYYFYQDLVTSLFVDKIFANTELTAQKLLQKKIVNPKKVSVVPFGIDTHKFTPATKNQKIAAKTVFGFSPSDFVISIVGRLDPAKDHLTFLKAAQIILKNLTSAHFFIVGSKLGDFSGKKNLYLETINNFLKDNPKLSKKVKFGDFTDDMPAVYHATDVLVSTSPSESFGLALAEGAASAIAIIKTDNAKHSLIIQNNQFGILIPPQNPQILAQKILYLAKNRNLRQKFGSAARSLAVQNFNIKNYLYTMQNNYLDLLARSAVAKSKNQ